MAGNKYSSDLRSKVLNDFQNGMLQKEISIKYGIHKSTICRIIKSRNIDTVHKGGRPRATTAREDRKIRNFFTKFPTAVPREAKTEISLDVSLSTIKRRAREYGLRSYRCTKKPYVSEKNRKARLQFARSHLNWTPQQWKNILWSDESKFNLQGSDGRCYIRRPRGEKYNPRYTTATVKYGGGNIMVWGCFSGHGIGPIHRITETMTATIYRDLLSSLMLPYAEWEMPLSWAFQHDNDPKHTARVVKTWLEEHQVNVMSWPPQSPDLNPIGNMWMIAKRNIGKRVFRNGEELFVELEKQWNSIPNEYIEKLISSMPKRCSEIIKNKGYATKY